MELPPIVVRAKEQQQPVLIWLFIVGKLHVAAAVAVASFCRCKWSNISPFSLLFSAQKHKKKVGTPPLTLAMTTGTQKDKDAISDTQKAENFLICSDQNEGRSLETEKEVEERVCLRVWESQKVCVRAQRT